MHQMLEFLATGLLSAGPWWVVVYVLATTHVTIVAVTVYLHRAQSHRAVKLHALPSHLFRFWLWLTTGMVTREWVAVHRCHHARVDEGDDPHSPQVHGIWRVLGQGTELYQSSANDPAVLEQFGAGTPDDWVERHVYSRFRWQGVGLLLIVNVLLFGAQGVVAWAVQMLWIPVLAAGVINGVGHYWGYRNFDCEGRATNIVPFGLLIGGEELHNNHHAFVTSAKLSVKWYEFDLGWAYIVMLRVLGLANVRPQPRLVRRAGAAAIDLTTLHAVLAHRPRLMAELSLRLRPLWRAELGGMPRHAYRECLALLARDPGHLSNAAHARLNVLLVHSAALRRVQALRASFAELWAPSGDSSQQLLAALRHWCAEAQRAGVPALGDFCGYLARVELVRT